MFTCSQNLSVIKCVSIIFRELGIHKIQNICTNRRRKNYQNDWHNKENGAFHKQFTVETSFKKWKLTTEQRNSHKILYIEIIPFNVHLDFYFVNGCCPKSLFFLHIPFFCCCCCCYCYYLSLALWCMHMRHQIKNSYIVKSSLDVCFLDLSSKSFGSFGHFCTKFFMLLFMQNYKCLHDDVSATELVWLFILVPCSIRFTQCFPFAVGMPRSKFIHSSLRAYTLYTRDTDTYTESHTDNKKSHPRRTRRSMMILEFWIIIFSYYFCDFNIVFIVGCMAGSVMCSAIICSTFIYLNRYIFVKSCYLLPKRFEDFVDSQFKIRILRCGACECVRARLHLNFYFISELVFCVYFCSCSTYSSFYSDV